MALTGPDASRIGGKLEPLLAALLDDAQQMLEQDFLAFDRGCRLSVGVVPHALHLVIG